MLEKLNQYSLVVELISREARISIILKETSVSKKLVKNTYRQLLGVSPSSGRMMESCRGLTRNTRQFKEATLFAAIFRSVESRNKAGNIQDIIEAFDFYKISSPSDLLDFTTAWVVAREVRSNKVKVASCPKCESSVMLISICEKSKDRCLVCNTVLKNSF